MKYRRDASRLKKARTPRGNTTASSKNTITLRGNTTSPSKNARTPRGNTTSPSKNTITLRGNTTSPIKNTITPKLKYRRDASRLKKARKESKKKNTIAPLRPSDTSP